MWNSRVISHLEFPIIPKMLEYKAKIYKIAIYLKILMKISLKNTNFKYIVICYLYRF